MCGRFTLIHSIQDIARTFNAKVPDSLQTTPRYNVAPTQDILTVIHDSDTHLDLLRWGLIPSWAKDTSVGSRMINARAETLAEKPSFKRLLASRRCLIVADGFYEWRQEPGSKSKTPMYITLKNNEPFAFAGLWDSWRDSAGQVLRTCTIITTAPNDLLSTIHNRMPVLLPAARREQWLDPQLHEAQLLTAMLTPYATDEMIARPVSRLVNDPKQDGAALIA